MKEDFFSLDKQDYFELVMKYNPMNLRIPKIDEFDDTTFDVIFRMVVDLYFDKNEFLDIQFRKEFINKYIKYNRRFFKDTRYRKNFLDYHLLKLSSENVIKYENLIREYLNGKPLYSYTYETLLALAEFNEREEENVEESEEE